MLCIQQTKLHKYLTQVETNRISTLRFRALCQEI